MFTRTIVVILLLLPTIDAVAKKLPYMVRLERVMDRAAARAARKVAKFGEGSLRALQTQLLALKLKTKHAALVQPLRQPTSTRAALESQGYKRSGVITGETSEPVYGLVMIGKGNDFGYDRYPVQTRGSRSMTYTRAEIYSGPDGRQKLVDTQGKVIGPTIAVVKRGKFTLGGAIGQSRQFEAVQSESWGGVRSRRKVWTRPEEKQSGMDLAIERLGLDGSGKPVLVVKASGVCQRTVPTHIGDRKEPAAFDSRQSLSLQKENADGSSTWANKEVTLKLDGLGRPASMTLDGLRLGAATRLHAKSLERTTAQSMSRDQRLQFEQFMHKWARGKLMIDGTAKQGGKRVVTSLQIVDYARSQNGTTRILVKRVGFGLNEIDEPPRWLERTAAGRFESKDPAHPVSLTLGRKMTYEDSWVSADR